MLLAQIVPVVLLSCTSLARLGPGFSRRGGKCSFNRDCGKHAPHCSDWGFCQWSPRFGSRPHVRVVEAQQEVDLGVDYSDYNPDLDLEYVQTDNSDYSDNSDNNLAPRIVEVTTFTPDKVDNLAENARSSRLLVLPISDRFVAPSLPDNVDPSSDHLPEHIDSEENMRGAKSEDLHPPSTISLPPVKREHPNLATFLLPPPPVDIHEHCDSKDEEDTTTFRPDEVLDLVEEEVHIREGGPQFIFTTESPELEESLPSSKQPPDDDFLKSAAFTKCPGNNIKACIFSCIPLQNVYIYGICVRECAQRCPL